VNAPIYYSDIKCLGDEDSVLNCSFLEHDLQGPNSPMQIAFKDSLQVKCGNEETDGDDPPCTPGDVRLGGNVTNKENKLEGRVEICFEGSWATLCDHSKWSTTEVATVCHQLTNGTAKGEFLHCHAVIPTFYAS